MKKTLIFTVLTLLISYGGTAKASDLSSKETLACEALICAVGIAIPESHSECKKVLTKFAAYLATLGFFSSKPRCPKVAEDGVSIDWHDVDCDEIQDAAMAKLCRDASNPPPDSCADLTDPQEIIACETRCNNNGPGQEVPRFCEIH